MSFPSVCSHCGTKYGASWSDISGICGKCKSGRSHDIRSKYSTFYAIPSNTRWVNIILDTGILPLHLIHLSLINGLIVTERKLIQRFFGGMTVKHFIFFLVLLSSLVYISMHKYYVYYLYSYVEKRHFSKSILTYY